MIAGAVAVAVDGSRAVRRGCVGIRVGIRTVLAGLAVLPGLALAPARDGRDLRALVDPLFGGTCRDPGDLTAGARGMSRRHRDADPVEHLRCGVLEGGG